MLSTLVHLSVLHLFIYKLWEFICNQTFITMNSTSAWKLKNDAFAENKMLQVKGLKDAKIGEFHNKWFTAKCVEKIRLWRNPVLNTEPTLWFFSNKKLKMSFPNCIFLHFYRPCASTQIKNNYPNVGFQNPFVCVGDLFNKLQRKMRRFNLKKCNKVRSFGRQFYTWSKGGTDFLSVLCDSHNTHEDGSFLFLFTMSYDLTW